MLFLSVSLSAWCSFTRMFRADSQARGECNQLEQWLRKRDLAPHEHFLQTFKIVKTRFSKTENCLCGGTSTMMRWSARVLKLQKCV